jgi:hypothetical protein
MNTESMHRIVRLDEQELQQLTKEVKETIATKAVVSNSGKPTRKKFTAAQFWNMKRRGFSASLNIPQIRVVD